jgi:hypothetical protein
MRPRRQVTADAVISCKTDPRNRRGMQERGPDKRKRTLALAQHGRHGAGRRANCDAGSGSRTNEEHQFVGPPCDPPLGVPEGTSGKYAQSPVRAA